MGSVVAHGQVVNHADDFVHKKNYSFSSVQLNSITYGNNMFVAVGKNGAIKTSVNGVEWMGIKPLSNNEPGLNKVVWNGKVFVAVGDESRIITSNNGKDWVAVNSGCSHEENLSDVMWDGKQFIAVGNKSSSDFPLYISVDYGIILKSSDGYTWSRELIEDIKLNCFDSIVYTGRGYFVNSQYYSENASNWSKVDNNGAIYDCTTKERLLLKINKGEVSTSNDGDKWNYKGKSDTIIEGYCKKIVWTGKIFVGLYGYGNSEIQTSSDGLTWNSIKSDMLKELEDICWNGNLIVAIGKDTEVYQSTDGIKWTRSYSGIKENFYDIVFNGKTFVAVGGLDQGYGLTLSSTDGSKWINNKTPIDACLNSVIWDGKRFVASGGNSVFFSKDGINWFKQTTQKYSFNNIAWNGKIFVASVSDEISNSGTIAYSTDGRKWTLKKIGDYNFFRSFNWNGSKFLIMDDNKAWVSVDGVNWISKNINLGQNVFISSVGSICMGTDFLINANNEVYKSKDGFNWTKYTPEKLGKYGYNAVIKTVTRNFVRGYGSLGNKDYISPDGINWAVLDYYDENAIITGIAYNSKDGKFVIVGNSGTLILLEPKKEKIVNSADNTNIIWSKYENKKFDFNKVPLNTALVSDDFDREKDNLNSITYNDETYVAVGDNGVIRTSKNSVNWTRVSSNVKSKLNYVIWIKGRFIAVGEEGTILESADGYTWNDHSLGNSSNLKKVIWDEKRFIIFSDSGIVYINEKDSSKEDLGKWESKKIGDYAHFIDGDFNCKTYVISYGYHGSNVYVSNDFENWTQLKVINEDTTYKYMYYNIMWDGEKFSAAYTKYFADYRHPIAGFDALRTRILESCDGVNWEEQIKIGDIKDSHRLNFNSYPISDGKEMTYMKQDWEFECLPGNIGWIERETGKAKQVNRLTVWTGNNFVLCGKEGAIYTSKDGRNWINRTTSTNRSVTNSKYLNKIIWDGDKYIITSLAGVFISNDGIEWSHNPIEQDKFEAVGTDGTVLLGKDKEWDKIDADAADQYDNFYIYKGINGYIAVGGGYKSTLGYNSKKRGIIFLSKDGSNWVTIDPGVEVFLSSVVYNKGKYVAVGDNGTIITSNDGTTWEKQNSGVMSKLIDIASNGSIFAVAGEGGIILVSTDGVNWTKTVETPNISFYEVTWDDISFKAAAICSQKSGYHTVTLFSSRDGVKWDTSYIESLYSNNYKSGFACNGDSYVIVTGEELPPNGYNSFIVGKNLLEKPISVLYNGSKLNFDTAPVIENGRVLVPMRAIFEVQGAEVLWDGNSKSITSNNGDKRIVLKVGSNQAIIDSDSSTLEVPPKIINGRTLVPLRFVSESFGAEVLWDGTKRRISITSKK